MRTLFLFVLLPALLSVSARADFSSVLISDHVTPTLNRASDQLSLALWLSGTGSVLFAHSYDNDTRDTWVNHQKMSVADATIGEHYISYGVNIGIAGLQLWLDHENGLAHARALAFTGLSTVTMKEIFQRERPNQANHQSFPSGHTSSAFATATSLSYAYGWKAGVPGFAMAAWTGVSRMADDDHWLSDVVGGAFLGFIWGRAGSFSTVDTEKKEASLVWIPSIAARDVGILMQVNY